MASSSSTCVVDELTRAPDRLGSKVASGSSIIDLLCCECGYPVISARQIAECGCRICGDCHLKLDKEKFVTDQEMAIYIA